VIRVVGAAVVLTTVLLMVAIVLSGHSLWPDLGNNLVAELIGALLTVWGVNWLLERDRRDKQTRLLRTALLGPLIRCVNAAKRLTSELDARNTDYPNSAYEGIGTARSEWRVAAREIAENMKFFTTVMDAETLRMVDMLEKQVLDMTHKVDVAYGEENRISQYVVTMMLLCLDVTRMMRVIEEADSPFLEVLAGFSDELDSLGDSHGIPRD